MMVIFNSPLISISIHAPREGCDFTGLPQKTGWEISIHAPREGCDFLPVQSGHYHSHFNPRTPRGVRLFGKSIKGNTSNFNPRTPRGVRRGLSQSASGSASDFNPRTPRGVRRGGQAGWRPERRISIHAPREGCDTVRCRCRSHHRDFNPRTPRGVRPSSFSAEETLSESISIHAPREGCDSIDG